MKFINNSIDKTSLEARSWKDNNNDKLTNDELPITNSKFSVTVTVGSFWDKTTNNQ